MTAPGSDSPMADLLRLAGVPEEEIVAAADSGLLAVLAVESQVLTDLQYDVADVARLTGLDEDRIRILWGALGFAGPHPGERIFNQTDVEQFRDVAALVDSGLADPEVVIQLTRVLGSSLARIANAQAELLATRDETSELALNDGAQWFGDRFGDVLVKVWRRHLPPAAASPGTSGAARPTRPRPRRSASPTSSGSPPSPSSSTAPRWPASSTASKRWRSRASDPTAVGW
jgi:hypothetical protein